jgi:hypothetical protein
MNYAISTLPFLLTNASAAELNVGISHNWFLSLAIFCLIEKVSHLNSYFQSKLALWVARRITLSPIIRGIMRRGMKKQIISR